MALDPLELATIGAILIVFFLWGPQKIPELARAIGRARREFDNATREFQNAAASLQNGTNPLFAPNPVSKIATPAPQVRSALPQSQPLAAGSPAQPPLALAKTGDELLIETARKLGISTQGKKREQIQEDIIALKLGTTATERVPAPPSTADDVAATG